PAVIEDQLATACFETAQVWIGRVQVVRHLLVRDLCISVDVESVIVPCRVVKYHVFEELGAEAKHEALFRGRADDPGLPAAGIGLAARRISGKQLLAVRSASSGIEFFQSGQLRRSETSIRFRTGALEHRRIE